MLAVEGPVFPPLLRGEEVAAGEDPLARAAEVAAAGTDAGLIVWNASADQLAAAVILAPESPLREAMGAAFAVSVGVGDALGALGPPELAVHFEWPGTIRVNGARCGRLRAKASTADPDVEPDWLVIGVEMRFLPPPEMADAPGAAPEDTCLFEEGCGDIALLELLESWSRHMLVWLDRLESEGLAPIHSAWRERGWKLGEDLGDGTVFAGLDELGGQFLRRGERTELRPLTDLLEG